ncbi:hypothetical protein ACP275_01G095400 [Erythranthe tilingii]
MESIEAIPGWIRVLTCERFFNSCLVHECEKKNEENTFCLDCCITLCLHCLPSHTTHSLLQIRRYVYHDVLRLKDAQELMDCSSIQPYITNGAKVLFLKQRPLRRQMMIGCSGKSCLVCERNLQDPYLFCSIFCKVSYSMSNNSMKQVWTPNSINPRTTSSGSSSSTSTTPTNCKILCSQSFKKKRRSCTSIVSSAMNNNRRKNVPRRSPLS